jgi:hypothetical protein
MSEIGRNISSIEQQSSGIFDEKYEKLINENLKQKQ